MFNLKTKHIRQIITGIIHGEIEITKESALSASEKGKEIMDFLIDNNLLRITNKCPKCSSEKLECLDNGTFVCINCGAESTIQK